jgi:hypothetical protein
MKTVKSRLTPTVVNFEKLSAIVAKLNSILFKDTKIECVTSLLNEISRLYGCKKSTFFAVAPVLQQCFERGNRKDQ